MSGQREPDLGLPVLLAIIAALLLIGMRGALS
jgi:hypothetical protein